MLIEHKTLRLIDYAIVDFLPFKTKLENVNHCVVLSVKLDNRLYSLYTPINSHTKELIFIDVIENNFTEKVFFNDERLNLPEELIESIGVKSEDVSKQIESHDPVMLQDFLFNETKQLWKEYANKTLQIRTDLHDFKDFNLLSNIENYRIRNQLPTIAAAMKELIKNAVALDSLNIIIENNKLYKKEYL